MIPFESPLKTPSHVEIIRRHFLDEIQKEISVLQHHESGKWRLPSKKEMRFITLLVWQVEKEYDSAYGIVEDINTIILDISISLAHTNSEDQRLVRLNSIKVLNIIRHLFSVIAHYRCSVYDRFDY